MYNLVTYCSQNYLPRLAKTISSWSSQFTVENIFIYTDLKNKLLLPQLPMDKKIQYYHIFPESTNFGTNCARKVTSIQHFIINNDKFDNAIFLDVDCMIIKDLDSLFDEFFDISVTVYEEVKEKHRTKNISSGFVAFKNTINAGSIIDLWADIQDNYGEESPCRDQKSLSEAITEMKNHAKANIKLLNSNVWNSHPYSGNIGYIKEWLRRVSRYKPYVLHFASGSIDSQDIIDKALLCIGEK